MWPLRPFFKVACLILVPLWTAESACSYLINKRPLLAPTLTSSQWEDILSSESISGTPPFLKFGQLSFFRSIYLVRLNDSARTKVIWKIPFSDKETNNEVLAYKIDRLLELNLIPTLVKRSFKRDAIDFLLLPKFFYLRRLHSSSDTITGTLQLYVEGAVEWKRKMNLLKLDHQRYNERNIDDLRPAFMPDQWPEARELLMKQALLDYILANDDRHIRNFFFTENNQLISIDHERAFTPSSLRLDSSSQTDPTSIDNIQAHDDLSYFASFLQSHTGRDILEKLQKNRHFIEHTLAKPLDQDKKRSFLQRIDLLIGH